MVPWCHCGGTLKDTRHSEGFVLDQIVLPQVLIILNKCMVMCDMTNNYGWCNVAWSCLRTMWHVSAIIISQNCCMFATGYLFISSLLCKPRLCQFNFVSLQQEAMMGAVSHSAVPPIVHHTVCMPSEQQQLQNCKWPSATVMTEGQRLQTGTMLSRGNAGV
jgi:hypothetical protein